MPALVDARDHPYFLNIREHLTTDEKAYDAELAVFLADLAGGDADIARGIVARFVNAWYAEKEQRALWPDLARRLPAAEKERAFDLDLWPGQRKTLEDLAARAPAPAP
jgi:hypothetical protein